MCFSFLRKGVQDVLEIWTLRRASFGPALRGRSSSPLKHLGKRLLGSLGVEMVGKIPSNKPSLVAKETQSCKTLQVDQHLWMTKCLENGGRVFSSGYCLGMPFPTGILSLRGKRKPWSLVAREFGFTEQSSGKCVFRLRAGNMVRIEVKFKRYCE